MILYVGLLLKCPQWLRLGQAGARNSMEVSHMGGKSLTLSNYYAINCCCSESALGSWSQEWDFVLSPVTLI